MSQDVQTAENEEKQTPLFYCLFFGGILMAETIIYGKAGWPYTEKARSAYREAQYFDVKQDPIKLEEMLLHSEGARKVPVIVEGGKVSIGYGGSWEVWSR